MTYERLIEEARNGDFEDRGWMIDIIGRLADALDDAEKRAESEHYAKTRAKNRRNDLASRIGRGVVAVQTGEPDHVVLGMLRGELDYDHNTPVPAHDPATEEGTTDDR